MSAEATKTEETTPVIPKTEQTSETPAATETPAVETTEAPSTTPATDAAAPATEEPKKAETAVEAVPASEGVLGYKAPGFLKQFHFSKHHFWFSDEPISANSLHHVREKHGNEHAAWARETGKGALFFSKRAEDKGTPSGMILLHEASDVAKEGFESFSVKVGDKIHRFEAASAKERDSWIVALEKKLEEAKAIKDEITGSESYKKNMEKYAKPTLASTGTAPAVKKERSKEPKKSVDAEPATAAATTTPAATETKTEETPAPVEEKKKTEKERSQSRKRTSIFGSLLSKKDEHKTEEKKEEKAEKKAEKEAVKEEKKVEAEQKKEEAKETHEPSKVVEAAEATAAAAVPAAVVSSDKEEKKEEEKTGPTTPTDKKAKRGSVFGSLFQKKHVTSPSSEKTEAEAATSAKDSDVPPVSETAPKLDEPIDTKPIDAAAVTAPATTTAEPTAEDASKDTATPAAEHHKTEKKSNFLSSFIKKAEGKKEESKEEKPTETTTDATASATDGTTETATETPASKDERPAREKRRTSLFGSLGTMKKKSDNKEETTKTSEDVNGTETKREKSPLPNKIGGLFRRASNAIKSDSAKDTTATKSATDATPASTETKDTPATEETTPATAPEATDSKIIGDVVPEAVHAQTVDKVATAPEVKASA